MVTETFFDLQRFADSPKWDEIATIGSSADENPLHRGNAYNDFYAIDAEGSEIAGYSIAGYSYDDAAPEKAASVINIFGTNPKGETVSLSEAIHVTLGVGAGANAGAVPINVESDESEAVVDVTIDLTASINEATVAVGAAGDVAAAHKVELGSAGGYVMFGTGATGQNAAIAGSTGAMLGHFGDVRASLIGGAGNDTFRGDTNDFVQGNGGADYFYDTASYTITDYNSAEDFIIASASGIDSASEIGVDDISGQNNKIQIGDGKELAIGDDFGAALHVKVVGLDTDGNVVTSPVRDIVLANQNGVVDASAAGDNGALIIANSSRGDGVHQVVGSAGSDQIYIGSLDTVNGGTGNDLIVIDSAATGVVVELDNDGGTDTVSGWSFGFDANNNSKLDVGSNGYVGRVVEDRLHISIDGGAAVMFEETKDSGSETHGQFNVLIGTTGEDRKYTAIRAGSENYAVVNNNGEIADYYVAEAEGKVIFTEGVDADLPDIDLKSENFQAIRTLVLNNNSHVQVYGSDNRETVDVAGPVGSSNASAGKAVSLGAENDVITSGYDKGSAGNTFYFGAGDGRDTIFGFNHYFALEGDPDVQHADNLIFAENLQTVRVDTDADGTDRVVFGLADGTDAVVYEESGRDINKELYLVKIGDSALKAAKIGSSTQTNTFQYQEGVSYYVGSSGEARDILTVGEEVKEREIWLDGSKNGGEFYRGIKTIDASAAVNTNISLAGGAVDNEIIGGGYGTKNFLWGGAGDNTLIGGAGKDYFMYYKDSRAYINGGDQVAEANHDVVKGYYYNADSADGDIIWLGDITIDDINQAAMAQSENLGIGSNTVTVEFKNGGNLTVENSGVTRFHMADGAVYAANSDSGKWTKEV